MGTLTSGDVGSTPVEEGAVAPADLQDQEINEPVTMRESMKLGPFQTEIIEGKIKPLLGESAHTMVAPLKTQPGGAQPFPPDLHVLYAYTWLKMGSNKVSMVVRNMSDSPIYLKKGVQIARIV